MRALAVILIAIFATACSKAEVRHTGAEAKAQLTSAVADVKKAGTEIKNDPQVKKAAADMKVAAKKAGAEIKVAAKDAGKSVKKAGADAKDAAHDAKEDAKEKANS